VLDFQQHIMTYANAGQDPPIIISADGKLRSLPERGMAMGMVADSTYKTAEIDIAPGDCIVFYTDGICEAMNARHEEFGEDHLHEVLRKHKNAEPGQLIQRILKEIKIHFNGVAQHDDMTLVVLNRQKK
jgi:sigma-B regulation protein RsbU (phosphoserine phosphatase)